MQLPDLPVPCPQVHLVMVKVMVSSGVGGSREGAGSHSALGCTPWEAHELSDNKQTLDLRVNSERGAVAPKGNTGEPGNKGLVEILPPGSCDMADT